MQSLQGSVNERNLSLDRLSNNDSLLLDALPFPCVIFDSFHQFIMCNPAFDKEFSTSDATIDLNYFLQLFITFPSKTLLQNHLTEAILPETFDSDTPCQQQVYCPNTGKQYLFRWSQITPSKSSNILLSISNFPNLQEPQRQPKKPPKQTIPDLDCPANKGLNATLIHELNQPLGTITNCLNTVTQILNERTNTSKRLKDSIHLARLQAKQATEMITGFRHFFSQSKPNKKLCALNSLISHVINLSQFELQQHHIKFELDIESSLPLLMLDRIMVEQILVNLINNAIDSMKNVATNNRLLTIKAETIFSHETLDTYQVKIIDTGCGVSKEHEHQIFKTFYTTKEKGMGIGLSLCQTLVQCHDGNLYFEHNPGGGSIFTFTLQSATETEGFLADSSPKFN